MVPNTQEKGIKNSPSLGELNAMKDSWEVSDDLSKSVREARRLKGMSQKELAHKLEISQSHLSAVEAGKRRVSQKVLKRLALVLEIEPELLLSSGDVSVPMIPLEELTESKKQPKGRSSRKVVDRLYRPVMDTIASNDSWRAGESFGRVQLQEAGLYDKDVTGNAIDFALIYLRDRFSILEPTEKGRDQKGKRTYRLSREAIRIINSDGVDALFGSDGNPNRIQGNAEDRPKEPIPSDEPIQEDDEQGPKSKNKSVDTTIVKKAPASGSLRIKIGAKTTTLTYNGTEYSSPTLLDNELVQSRRFEDDGAYGQMLFRAIINENPSTSQSNNATKTGFENALRDSNNKIPIELEIDPNDPILRTIWWEFISDPNSKIPIGVQENLALARRVGQAMHSEPIPSPLRILVVLSSPRALESLASDNDLLGLHPLDIPVEEKIINDSLGSFVGAGLVEYEIVSNNSVETRLTPQHVTSKLQGGQFDALHIVAHGIWGEFDDDNIKSFRMVMESDLSADSPMVSEKELVAAIDSSGVKLVVLAACQSSNRHVGENNLSGLGQVLVQHGVPFVVSMQARIRFSTAQLFVQHFYNHLIRTGNIDRAMAATRMALFQKLSDRWQWGLPVLQKNSETQQVVKVDSVAVAKLPPFQPIVLSEDNLTKQAHTESLLRAVASAVEVAGVNPRYAETVTAFARNESLDAWGDSLSPLQDRDALKVLETEVKIDPGELRSHLDNNVGMKLPESFYGRVASALNSGKHVILIGPPGTGKTTVANAICDFAVENKFSLGTSKTTASADWTTFDTVGGYVPTSDQTLVFRSGCFLRAITEGYWLIVDEINRAEIDKAVGELFTVLSGQPIELPYRIGNHNSIRVVPSGPNATEWHTQGKSEGDFVVHPSWRAIGTMNIFDKSSLFALSFAFMRRFAFVDLDVPSDEDFASLRARWLDLTRIQNKESIGARLGGLFGSESKLMQYRPLGPAIAKDMIEYISDRSTWGEISDENLIQHLGESFLLYACPQLDGLERTAVLDVYKELEQILGDSGPAASDILARVRAIYPHISEWPTKLDE